MKQRQADSFAASWERAHPWSATTRSAPGSPPRSSKADTDTARRPTVDVAVKTQPRRSRMRARYVGRELVAMPEVAVEQRSETVSAGDALTLGMRRSLRPFVAAGGQVEPVTSPAGSPPRRASARLPQCRSSTPRYTRALGRRPPARSRPDRACLHKVDHLHPCEIGLGAFGDHAADVRNSRASAKR